MAATLVILGVLFVVLAFSVSRSARRQRERMEEERRRREAVARHGGGTSPFEGMPFGGLFDTLLSGPGMSSRSLEYDPQTGEWVEVDDAVPQPGQGNTHQDGNLHQDVGEGKPTMAPPAPSPPRRPAATSGPFGGLFGGMMGGLGGTGGGGDFEVESPASLGDFDDVGGMESLKQELRDTVGLMLEHPEDAERYGIEWNGILLHGPPGVGKTFFARAVAGEYEMNLIHVSTGDLVSSLQGGSAQNISKAFDAALGALPCLLFFDEFDSVAARRGGTPDQESRRTVNQLLTSLEVHRDERRLLVMAATNSVEHLDPAVIRSGRFDRQIRIDLPDAAARGAIFRTELDDRPASDGVDLEELVRRTEGLTPAAIAKVVDTAALEVFRRAAQSGKQLELKTEDLLGAVGKFGGQDRPMIEHWTWESLILPTPIKRQLQQLQAVIEQPESARRFGVDPPTGLLLAGPPGTGKTTVAKVLAAQAHCSFYPVSGADVMSKWVGESEGNIRRLFERARENRPSIVFIDEIDAIAGRRGPVEVHDSQVNQLLADIDGVAGQRGLFIVGATNRPDQLDPALLRGGRLSRTVVLGLPDEGARLEMLKLHTARMPTIEVDLVELARKTEGLSPADLKALAQEAALAAMARGDDAGDEAQVRHEDFEEALTRLRPREPALA